ncbi:ACT domain-containing protein [Candidatus Micrarchaeota archaeon]|nr:ACT domain-containing protein [Candidatus Micrarchaeota archaeon]
MKENVSELVWLYVKKRPLIKSALKDGIVNYSALARRISHDLFSGSKKTNAVKMALVRLYSKLSKNSDELESKILDVLQKSSLSIKTKISVIITRGEIERLKYLSYVESRGIVTYVVDDLELEKVKHSKLLIQIEKNLNLIIIHSPPSIEETPGVISHIIDSLSAEGINIVEFISCYTDTILVIKQADTTRTHQIIADMMS